MNSTLGTFLKWAVVLAALFTLANEVGRVGITYYNTSNLADEIAQEAMKTYQNYRSLGAAKRMAEKKAVENGAIFNDLTYQQSPPKMFVNISVPVQGTWVIHRFEFTKPYTVVTLQGESGPIY